MMNDELKIEDVNELAFNPPVPPCDRCGRSCQSDLSDDPPEGGMTILRKDYIKHICMDCLEIVFFGKVGKDSEG